MSTPEFDRFAENYDAALARGISLSGEDRSFFARGRVAWLARTLDERQFVPGRILDYGCGTGTATPYLLALRGAHHLLGLDISANSIEIARRAQHSPHATFATDAAYAPDASYDLAFCNGVFHHIPPAQRPDALDYIRGSLRPGGLFAFWENNPLNPGTQWVMARIPFDRDAIKIRHGEARALLRSAGFDVLDTSFQFIFPGFLRMLRPLEAPLAVLPLGSQYMILTRRPS